MIQPVLRGEKSVHCRDVKGLQPQDSVGGGGGAKYGTRVNNVALRLKGRAWTVTRICADDVQEGSCYLPPG